MNSSPKALMTRILVGYLGLYPTLLLVLTLLKPITQHQSFPMMVLIEVIVLVPVTQLISFPLAGWLITQLKILRICFNKNLCWQQHPKSLFCQPQRLAK
jgi:antibiotic biosynthesis monooxygenase (ABM) superfamily enzyme